ncbi:hypothetical protein P7C70_g707, partial [Phenoliferia sp. Uapishka_3]
QQRSPSPAPPAKPKPPPRTVRLVINLPAPENVVDVPEYSIADLARDAGFLDEEEEERAQDGSGSGSGGSGDESGDSEGDDDEEGGSKKKDKGPMTETEDEKMQGVENSGVPTPLASDANGIEGLLPPKKRRKKAILGRLGGYDTEDPFVDDSDLALYEPMYYHRPKREGYFVCNGPLEVISDAKGPTRGRQPGSKNKPKYDEQGNLIPATRKVKGADGTTPATGPVASTSKVPAAGANGAKPRKSAADEAPQIPLPSVSSIPIFGSGVNVPIITATKSGKKAGVFSPELQAEIDMLKAEVAKESFEVKNKFPPRLKPILVNVALRALDLKEYDDDFFAILPKIFPYNLFTMKKLVKREIFPARMERIDDEQTEHLQTIENGINDSITRQRAEFEQQHQEWVDKGHERDEAAEEKRKQMEEESLNQDKDVDMPPPPVASVSKAVVPTSDAPTVAGEDTTMGSPGPEGEGRPDDDAKEPKWKFKMTEPMRLALYYLLGLEDERTELTMEKQYVFGFVTSAPMRVAELSCATRRTLEKACEREGPTREKPYSALQARKAMYARVGLPSAVSKLRTKLINLVKDCCPLAQRLDVDQPALSRKYVQAAINFAR